MASWLKLLNCMCHWSIILKLIDKLTWRNSYDPLSNQIMRARIDKIPCSAHGVTIKTNLISFLSHLKDTHYLASASSFIVLMFESIQFFNPAMWVRFSLTPTHWVGWVNNLDPKSKRLHHINVLDFCVSQGNDRCGLDLEEK